MKKNKRLKFKSYGNQNEKRIISCVRCGSTDFCLEIEGNVQIISCKNCDMKIDGDINDHTYI